MATLEQKFNAANDFLSVNSSKLSEMQRLRLYGLVKQVKNGDCTVAPPPKTDAGSRAKWEAWNNCKHMTKEAAMTSFVSSLELYDNRFNPNTVSLTPSSAPTPTISTAKPVKEGTLYKQRDVFKGWRPRHFVLQDDFLHYFVDAKDILPKKSMQVTGCTVTPVNKSKPADVEYYPFVISHPTSTKTYNLASTNKAETDAWIAAIQKAASATPSPAAVSNVAERILPRRPPPVTNDSDDESSSANPKLRPVNYDRTVEGVPAKFVAKVDAAVETLIDAVSPDAEGWDNLFEKNGVKAYKRAGNIICVRGDSLIPYPILNLFQIIYNSSRKRDLDPQLHSSKLVKQLSPHTCIEHLRFKQVWPTAIRDYVNIVHWRLLKNGCIAVVAFSEKFDELCPVEQGIVRAELILSGYLLTPTAKGTNVNFIVQTDLKGTLPSSIVNFISTMQPMCLANLKSALDHDVAMGKLAVGKFKQPSYDEMLFLADNLSAEHIGLSAEMAGIATHNSLVPEEDVAVKKETTKEKAKAKLAETISQATNPEYRRQHISQLTVGRLAVLLLPVAVYIAVQAEYRGPAFIVGFMFAIGYVMRLHLGIPKRKVSTHGFAAVPSGRMIINFPVDLARLIRYFEIKREETNLDVSITHLVIKACGVSIGDVPEFNGHVIGEDFYPSRSSGVDVSVSLETTEGDSSFLKVVDADRKPVAYIANEMITRTQSLKDGTNETHVQTQKVSQIVNLLPNVLGYYIKWGFSRLGSYGFTIPLLGIEGFPHGVCTVVSVPRLQDKHHETAPEHDLSITLVPQMTDSTSPITVSIAGVSIHPGVDKEKKLSATHVLSLSVAIDTNAASLAHGRKFCSRLQHYLNNPMLLDKVDRMSAISKEDAKIAEEKHHEKLAGYKKAALEDSTKKK